MPIPSPHPNEKENKFISRCMGDSVMNKEYPDVKQRSAICYSRWRAKKLMELSSNNNEKNIQGSQKQ